MSALLRRAPLLLALVAVSVSASAQAPPAPAPAPASASASAPPPALPSAPPPAPARALVAVFDTHALGVDPAAAAVVTAELRRTAEALGYAVLPPDAARAAVARMQTAGGVSSDRATELTRAVGARHGVFARLGSDGRAYLVELQIVSSQGGAPATARGAAGAADLARNSGQLLTTVLPPAPPPAPPVPVAPPAPVTGAAPTLSTAPDRQPSPESSRYGKWRVALQTEAAFGIGGNDFYNHLAGARLDHRFTRRAAIGAYLGYANLKGREGRAHNVLSYALVEYRIPFGDGTFGLPLRYGAGYLPKNGPFMRTSAGLGFSASEQVDLVLELLAPTFWITHDQAVVSLDLAAEVALSF